MAKPLADAIVKILQQSSANSEESWRLAILLDTKPEVALAASALPIETVVIGDRFRLLYRTYRKIEKKRQRRPLIIEASFDALPVRGASLDAIILTHDIFSGRSSLKSLKELRTLLRPDGIIIWPHLSPSKIRRVSRIGARLGTKAVERSDLTSLTMEAGFAEIGQIIVSSRLVTWIITTGKNKKKPSQPRT